VRTRAMAVIVTLGILAACGGGGPTGPALTRAQLVDKVNAECLKLATAGNDLVAAQDPSAQGTQVSKYLHAAASQLRARVGDIAKLVPPANLAGQVAQFVSLLNNYAGQLDALANGVRSGETYEALLSRSGSQVSALNGLSDQSNKIAANLNFKDCAT